MATRLYEVLTFPNVPAGEMATQAHHLNVNGVAITPDFLYPDAIGFALVNGDSTAITVQNDGSAPATLRLALVSIFSIERLFGQGGPTALSTPGSQVPRPFYVSGGAGSGGGFNPAAIGSPQAFSYLVTGAEPDLSNLVIPLPAVRASAAYNVIVTPQTAVNQLSCNVPGASKAVGQFVLTLSANATVGDRFSFYVCDDFTTI